MFHMSLEGWVGWTIWASGSFVLFLFIEGRWFKTLVKDWGRITESPWNRVSWHLLRFCNSSIVIGSLFCLSLGPWHQWAPLLLPQPSKLYSKFTSFLIPLPPNFQHKALSDSYVCTSLYHLSDPCPVIKYDYWQFLPTNSKYQFCWVSFPFPSASMLRRPGNMVRSKSGRSWMSCSRLTFHG